MAGGKRDSKEGDSNGAGASLKQWRDMIMKNRRRKRRKRNNK
jgi:hypothetical protein